MNSDDVFQLVRSGHLFGAFSPQAARELHNLRRFLNVDCPNTYEELAVNEDQSIARGQNMDAVMSIIADNFKHPRLEHYQWLTDSTDGRTPHGYDADRVIYAVEEDPFYQRGCVARTVPRRIDYRFLNYPLETPEETQSLAGTKPTYLHRVTGLSLHSVAVLRKTLCPNIRHRCSLQVLSLPLSNASSVARSGASSSSPYRGGQELQETSLSPSKVLAAEHYDNKAFTPHCCFGIYCPSLPEEPQINAGLQHRAPFTSRRWLGLYWADGTTVPTLGLLGCVTPAGVMKVTQLQGRRQIAVGDVLTIETRPKDDAVSRDANVVLFFLNGIEVARVTIDLAMPVATNMSDCYFAVQMSEGASVATFVHCT